MDDYSEPLDLTLPSVKMKNTTQNSLETDLPLDLSKKRIDNPETIQTGPFTVIKNRSTIHQSCGHSSMSYINSPKPMNAHSCIPTRNNFSDTYEDEQESPEEPFDFSCRYAEKKIGSKKSKGNNGNYSIYAETDLDQPTDYSLRYAENDSDSDSEVCDKEEKTVTVEFVGDTVKTYCTEGTPYETPLNFSTSTSMSDLRITEKNVLEEKTKIDTKNDKIPEEEIIVTDDQPKIKTEFNSGLTSPEKPMNYCEEGTPGYFSRVSSFGSLNSAEKLSEDKHKSENQMDTPKSDKMQQKLPGSEVKVVKFENIVNYCEETPLMFSRSSSLGSLDSIEQSMHDDRSSVISDFSRLTSGIISPSEIPDSPTQTVPPSPKQRKSSDFGITNRRQCSARRSLPTTKSSIFEDDVTKFKEENTPAQFSVATSLSSLTIDDHDETHIFKDQTEQNCSREQDKRVSVDKDETDGPSFQSTRNSQNRYFQDSKAGTSTFPSLMMPSPLSVENTICAYNTEDTPAVLSHNGSISELSLSALSMLDEEPVVNRTYLSENSSQSSGERRNNSDQEKQGNREEIEEVWVRRESFNKTDSNGCRGENSLPPYTASRDEFCQFAVEDSPAQFSLRSSLSHLTMDSEMASGILDFSPSKETPETSLNVRDSSPANVFEQNVEDSVGVVETQEDQSITESSAPSINNPEIQDIESNTAEIPGDPCPNVDGILNGSNEITKSFELRSDDSRCNSMKKRKWKWKWQFGSEDGHQSESGESTQTDKHSSNNEEFDNGRRSRVDKNNAGSLDASLKKKKWWKWKFNSKEKDSSGAAHAEVQEPVYDCTVDEDQNEISNSVEEKESHLKEIETRNKSKRWKWKWKLNFKDDENSKSEKSSLGLSKLKHQVSPELTKEPLCVSQSEETTIIRFSPEKHSKSHEAPEKSFVRRKLDTPEPSDSEQSVIFEELDEHNSSEVHQTFTNRNSPKGVNMTECSNKKNGYLSDSSNGKPTNFAALVEECIQLGMPRKKNIPEKSAPRYDSPEFRAPDKMIPSKNETESKKDHWNISPKIIAENPRATLKETKLKSNSNGYNEDNIGRPKLAVRNITGESSFDTSTRLRTTNFDSSSLNRFSLGKGRRNVFNSNDDILRNIPKETAEKVAISNVERPIYDESHGKKKTDVIFKTEGKLSNEVMGLADVKLTKQEMSNSQFVRCEYGGSVAKTCGSKPYSGRGAENCSQQIIPKAVSTQSEKTTKSASDSGKNPDFAAIIEECIQLGMPKRKESSEETLSPTLSTSSVHQKPASVTRWPEYLSKISSENNKCASLPKASSYLTAARSYCASNEDFATTDSQMRRGLIVQGALEKNVKNQLKSEKPEMVYAQPKTGFEASIPIKERSQFNTGISQSEEEYEESLYANVDETRSYSNRAVGEQLPYGFKSLLPEMVKPYVESPQPKRGLNGDKENNSPSVGDCFLRRSLDRSSSQDISKKSKYESVKGNVPSGPRIADSEDEAVYANTTERYTILQNQIGPKTYNSHEDSRSPILHEKKFTPYNRKNDEPQKNYTTGECSSESNQDFAAIIEECIQLGMPKRKEFSRETLNSNLSLSSTNSRSNSATRCADYACESVRSVTLPKGATYFSRSQNYYSSNEDFNRTGSQRKKTSIGQNTSVTNKTFGTFGIDSDRALKSSPQISSRLSTKTNTSPYTQPEEREAECMKSDGTREEETEESLYVNVSKHAGYSRSTNKPQSPIEFINPPEVTKPIISNPRDVKPTEPRYSALVEECIKLGMPSKKISDIQKYLKNITPPISDSDFTNPPERYSTFKSSMSESGLNRSPRSMITSNYNKRGPASVHGGDLDKKAVLATSSSTIEKALAECIQMGWPKKKDLDKNPPPKFSNISLIDTSVKKTDKTVSKNVNVASVVRNMQRPHLACSKVPSSATDAKDDLELVRNGSTTDAEEIITDRERNGFDSIFIDDNQAESEMSFASLADIDVNLLDPQIVLESLEKYTAKLISEAELRLGSKNPGRCSHLIDNM